MMHKRSRYFVFRLLAWFIIISQVITSMACADSKTLNKASTLAPPSIFSSSSPYGQSAEFRQALISKIEFLTIAFNLYASLIIDKQPPSYLKSELKRHSGSSEEFFRQLLMFNFNGIRIDRKGNILYIPYADDLEVRVYEKRAHPQGLPVENGQRLLEHGSGSLYDIEVVTPSSSDSRAGIGLSEYDESIAREITDLLAGLFTRPVVEKYRARSERERNDINEAPVYREVFDESIIPKLRTRRIDLLATGREPVLTIGITGDAASGKTVVSETLRRDLAREFKNVKMILFDHWLLQASDRPIDPATGKPTEDVFKKFEVDLFVRSIKAFIKGQGLLKPIYDQTAKGNLKMTVDEEGRLVILFGPKRNIAVVDTPEGIRLSVQDENGSVLETALQSSVFEVQFGIEDAKDRSALGEFVLKVFDTRIRVGALESEGHRVVQIIDKEGSDVSNLVDTKTGELLADSSAIITRNGHIDTNGIFTAKPWKVKEYIPYKEGVFIIEGLLPLYDYPGQPPGESLPELYTTSIFIDTDFEVRLERGLLREKARVERLKGMSMPPEDEEKYIDVFTRRKDYLEDPYIASTRKAAEFVCTTMTRAEGLFSLYRNGKLLSEGVRPAIEKMGLDAEGLQDELGRIESDFILDRFRRFTVEGELQFERKIESPRYNVYFLREGMVIKVPKAGRDSGEMLNKCVGLLRPKAGDVMVPCIVVDASALDIKLEGTKLGVVLVQNEISPLDTLLAKSTEEDARQYLDEFFDLQKDMWLLGIVDRTPRFDRYGHMMTNKGRSAVLLYAVDGISADYEDFNPDKLRALIDNAPPDLREYCRKKIDKILVFMTSDNFGSNAAKAKMLPSFFHPQVSSEQLDYLTSLVMEYKAEILWELFKMTGTAPGVTRKVIWTKLWIDNVARYTPEAREALETFYGQLVLNPDLVKDAKSREMRNLIIRSSQPLSRQDLIQINKFLAYLGRISLKMVQMGNIEGEAKSVLRIKNDVYEQMDPQDLNDLYNILSNPSKLAEIITCSGGRINIAFNDSVTGEGQTIYLDISLRRPVNINGKIITMFRIKGARPSIEPGTYKVLPYTGRGYVGRAMESYASGSIITYLGQPISFGTMPYSSALTEYEMMDSFSGSACDTDTAIGVGRYRDFKFKNRPVGYVICGVEGRDYRFNFETGERNRNLAGNLVAQDAISGRIVDITGSLPEFYERLGKAMRYFHDSGYSHRYPHIGNIGLRFIGPNRIEPVLRDFETTRDISTDPMPERIANRFLDISRVLYDLLQQREYWEIYDGELAKEEKSFAGLAKNFLKGYFHELDTTSAEFKGLCEYGVDFVSRLNMLAGIGGYERRDYEELNENNPYFGKLVAQLKAAAERASGNLSSEKRESASGIAQQISISQEINKVDRDLGPAVIVMDQTRPICHIIDPSLIPIEQVVLITQINKLTRSDNIREKVIIGKPGESVEDTIEKALAKYPNAIIDVAVRDEKTQEELARRDMLSLVFQPEEGPCNFRQIEGIIAALRALQRDDKEALLRLYRHLTGRPFNESVPEDMRAFIRRLIFRLPAIDIKNADELRKLNENLLKLIQSA